MSELVENLTQSKAEIYAAVLIASWIIFLFSNLLITAVYKGNKKNWGQFWGIWTLTALITGIFLIFMVMAPEQILNFINWIKELFK